MPLGVKRRVTVAVPPGTTERGVAGEITEKDAPVMVRALMVRVSLPLLPTVKVRSLVVPPLTTLKSIVAVETVRIGAVPLPDNWMVLLIRGLSVIRLI